MATDLGLVGSGQNKTSSTTVVLTFNQDIAIGTFLHIVLTCDNYASTSAPTITLPSIGGVTPTARLTATGSGVTTTAGAGVWTWTYTLVTTSSIANATTVTFTFSNAVVAKAVVAHGALGVANSLRGSVAGTTSTSGAPTNTTSGTALSAGDIVFGGAGFEMSGTPTSDSDTTNGTWGTAATIGTSGSSSATNVTSISQMKVVNATGTQTYNPTGSADSIAVVYGFLPGVTTFSGTVVMTAPSSLSSNATLPVQNAAVSMTAASSLSATATPPAVTEGYIAYGFDENTGTTSANKGTTGPGLTGVSGWTSPGHSGTGSAMTGTSSSGASFVVPSSQGTTWTLMGWFRARTTGTWASLWEDGTHYLEINGLVLDYYNGVTIQGPTLTSNTWYHIAITQSGTTGRLVVNGSQVATGTASVTLAAATYKVGGSASAAYTGEVDDFRVIVGTALTDAQIQTYRDAPVSNAVPVTYQGATSMTAPSTLTSNATIGIPNTVNGTVVMTAASEVVAAATVSTPPASPFATSVSGRNILDQHGDIYFLSMYHQWNLIGWGGGRNETGAGTTTPHSAFDAVASALAGNGNNAILTLSITTNNGVEVGPNLNGNTWDGVAPWAGGVKGSLNEAYWARVDDLIDTMASYGITVYLYLISSYTLSSGAAFNGMTAGQATSFGTALGNRYKYKPNIIWGFGADYFDDVPTQIQNIINALAAAGDTHLYTIEWMAESSTTVTSEGTSPGTVPSGYAFSDVYTYNAAAFEVRHAWSNQTKPVVFSNGYYYQDGTSGTQTSIKVMTDLLGWSFTSGSQGFMVGSEATWQNDAGYLTAIQTETWPNGTYPTLVSRLTSISGWAGLVPDLSSTFVTSSRGTDTTAYASGGSGPQYNTADAVNNYLTAGVRADGKLGVLYTPIARSGITINTSKLVSSYDVYWIDPHNGNVTATSVAGSYTTPGNNSNGTGNWYLVFAESGIIQAAVAMTAPSSFSVTGIKTTAGTSVMTIPSILVSAAMLAFSGASVMTAVSVLSVTASLGFSGAVVMTAQSVMASNAVRDTSGAVAMTAPATTVATASLGFSGAVVMTAPDVMVATADASGTYSGASAMTIPSILVVAAVRSTSGNTVMTAQSVLVVAADRITSGAVVMTAPSTLVSAAIKFSVYAGAAVITAPSTLIVAAVRSTDAAVAMTAVSILTSAAIPERAAASIMTAASTLVVAAVRATAGSVTMTAQSVLTDAANVTMVAAVSMTALSSLVAAAVRITSGAVVMIVPSVLTSDATVFGGSTVFMSSASVFAVNGFKTTAGSVNMTVPSVSVVAGFKTTAGASFMTAASILVAAAVRATAAAVAMTGSSTLSATARATMFAAVAMQALSVLISYATIGGTSTSPFRFWDGAIETPLSMKHWNGTSEVPLTSYSIV